MFVWNGKGELKTDLRVEKIFMKVTTMRTCAAVDVCGGKKMLFSSSFHGLQELRVELPARLFEKEENRIKNFSTFHHEPAVPKLSVRFPRYFAVIARHQLTNLTTSLFFPAVDCPNGMIYVASSS